MGRVRVYIKSFDPSGNYLDDFTDISRDVLKVGGISQALDNSEYDVGILRNSAVKITVRNDHGLFSEAGSPKSLFLFKRADSVIKITWNGRAEPMKCGFARAYNLPIGEEIIIFEGLLSEVSSTSQIDDQKIEFQILGFESLLDRVEVPYTSISDGDLISEVIYACLNQSFITEHLTVDQANILPGIDQAIDIKAPFENQTVKQALADVGLLLGSNSILYIKDRVIYVADREPTDDLIYTFYGQASTVGRENVTNIKNYRDGINRVFNYLTWEDTSIVARDVPSELLYGTLKKALGIEFIQAASTTKITNILEGIRDEFKNAKTEFLLETPLSYDSLPLFLKDKVSVDYPTIFRTADGQPLPLWGQVIWGDFTWPIGQWSLTIESSERFKIMSLDINLDNETILYSLRKV